MTIKHIDEFGPEDFDLYACNDLLQSVIGPQNAWADQCAPKSERNVWEAPSSRKAGLTMAQRRDVCDELCGRARSRLLHDGYNSDGAFHTRDAVRSFLDGLQAKARGISTPAQATNLAASSKPRLFPSEVCVHRRTSEYARRHSTSKPIPLASSSCHGQPNAIVSWQRFSPLTIAKYLPIYRRHSLYHSCPVLHQASMSALRSISSAKRSRKIVTEMRMNESAR